MKPSEASDEASKFGDSMDKLKKAVKECKIRFRLLTPPMKIVVVAVGAVAGTIGVAGLSLGGFEFYCDRVKPMIENLTNARKKESYNKLIREMNDDIGENGNLRRFKRINEKYDKMKILNTPTVSRQTFIDLCCEDLKLQEKEDIEKLFHYYYHGLIRKICETGFEAHGKAPIKMLCSEEADSCFYAKTMTYIVSSHIASIPSSYSRELHERRIRGFLRNYTNFCEEYLSQESSCKGLYFKEDDIDFIVREVLEKKYGTATAK